MEKQVFVQGLELFDEAALMARLTSALKKRQREVIFLIGSPFSAPANPGSRGVPSVEGIIATIRDEFQDDPGLLNQFDLLVSNSRERRYQEAFRFLQSRRGQSVANELVRNAVLSACSPSEIYRAAAGDEPSCQLLEADSASWTLSPATKALAAIIALQPALFGKAVLTTNFDPLLEIALNEVGSRHYRPVMQGDGNLSITSAQGCQIIHLHGYWYGYNTLHTVRQLTQPRPQLKASLNRLLRGRLIVVCGYGGWDDIFTTTLLEMVADDADNTEILWSTFSDNPTFPSLINDQMKLASDKGKIFVYSSIDCNLFLPNLRNWWEKNTTPLLRPGSAPLSPVNFPAQVIASLAGSMNQQELLEGDVEDRPPVVEFCLGRDDELALLESSASTATFITGIGGQGKSTIAAKFFTDRQKRYPEETYIWRDCKEEGELFENQLAAVVESLTSGSVRGLDLAKQGIQVIIEILLPLLERSSALFVFDNIDHYIDLEAAKLTSNVELFVKALLERALPVKLLFTSRPSINFPHPAATTIRLQGLSLQATKALFVARRAKSTDAEIQDAHSLTKGHAFWLDLLAIQVAKQEFGSSLSQLVDEMRRGKGELPNNMLHSIWSKLRDREQIVLRAMAETVRPAREQEIADYIKSAMTFQKVFKALTNLRSANLVVVKRLRAGEEVLELHPLVRTFIRKQFSQKERLSFIDGIIKVYNHFIGLHRSSLAERPTLVVLQNWTQAAELSVAAGRIDIAYTTLAESTSAFASSAYPREFTRVARLLLGSGDFVGDYKKFGGFDKVFQGNVQLLSYLGEFSEVDSLLNRYALTVPEKDARFILYCHLRSYTYWIRKSFSEAVDWGRRGLDLKVSSGVDTNDDIEHTLALALRDGGNADAALPIFLQGRSLDEVTDTEEFDEDRGGAHYGNIGRCLHLMGEFEGALICYQKSALLIEKDQRHEHILNQGFIRLWVGEVFIGRGRSSIGLKFLEAARRKWEQVNPLEASRIAALQEQNEYYEAALRVRSNRVEGEFQSWIVGKVL